MPEDKLARALGSKIRRDIIRYLVKNTELSVHGIADILKLSEPSASKHLKKLYDLGLINLNDRGRERFYSLKIVEMKKLIEYYDKIVKNMR
jgi:DNA-binding transcriptional ArsR family regulator